MKYLFSLLFILIASITQAQTAASLNQIIADSIINIRTMRPPGARSLTEQNLGARLTDIVNFADGKASPSDLPQSVGFSDGYVTVKNHKRVANVVILSGQSNALGQFASNPMAALPAQYTGTHDNIQIWWTGDYDSPVAGHFESMQAPVNTRDKQYTNPGNMYYNTTGWSVEQSMGKRLSGVFGDTLYVIKSAVGALNITYWSAPSGVMWLQLQQYITEAIDSLEAKGYDEIRFTGFVWMQGESDVLDGIHSQYQTRLRTFIANWRAIDSRLTTTPFIMWKLRTDGTVGANAAVINAAFDTMALESQYNISLNPTTISATLFDGLHYTPTSYVNMGKVSADTIIKRSNFLAGYIGEGLMSEITSVSNTFLPRKTSTGYAQSKWFDDGSLTGITDGTHTMYIHPYLNSTFGSLIEFFGGQNATLYNLNGEIAIQTGASTKAIVAKNGGRVFLPNLPNDTTPDSILTIVDGEIKRTSIDNLSGAGLLTANYIPKKSGSGFANSIIYDDGTKVGIGTNNPQATFVIHDAAHKSLEFVPYFDATLGALIQPIDRSGGGAHQSVTLYTLGATSVRLYPGGTERYSASSTGNHTFFLGAGTPLVTYNKLDQTVGSKLDFLYNLVNSSGFYAPYGKTSIGIVANTAAAQGGFWSVATAKSGTVADKFKVWDDAITVQDGGTHVKVSGSIFDITSTTKGTSLYPRMTQAQRDAVSSPATGVGVYCTDCTATDASTGVIQTWNGTAWKNAW